MKTLPHGSRGWWGGAGGGTTEVLFVTDIQLDVETPDIELEMEDVEIILEVEIYEEE